MNTYIYHTVNGYIMIDTGYEHSMKNVEKRANKQGIAFSEIKYIFLTHAHDDHAGFLNELLPEHFIAAFVLFLVDFSGGIRLCRKLRQS